MNIEAKNLSKIYGDGENRVVALDHANLPVLRLKIVNIGFALNCFQFRRVGFPLLLTFSVSCFVSIDDIVRCSAYCICCHNGSFLARCFMIDLTH